MAKYSYEFKLNDILVVVGFPKATYMYWQKRFDRVNPNQELEEKIIAIRKEHKDYGYRRIHTVLRKQGFYVNKKKLSWMSPVEYRLNTLAA